MAEPLDNAVARRLATILAGQGHTVRLTRPGDDVRALTDRTSLANRVDAVAFVSLHANASTVAAVQGAETYYMSLDDSSTDEHAAATAQLENRSGEDGGRSSLDLILWDLAQAEVLNESAELALYTMRRPKPTSRSTIVRSLRSTGPRALRATCRGSRRLPTGR